jgi:hypothetical protein
VKGGFDFILYPGIWSELLLKWAINPVNSGRTTPWTTTDSAGVMRVGDHASLAFYEAILGEDGSTFRRDRYNGCKCDDWAISATDQGEGRVWRISGSFTGQKAAVSPSTWDSVAAPDATEFPAPADTDFPTGPYLIRHLAVGNGTVKIGKTGDSQTHDQRKAVCQSLTIRGRNTMSAERYTSDFLTAYRYRGRSVTADVAFPMDMTPDDRDRWRQLTALDVEFLIDNSTHSIKIDFHTKNLFRPWGKSLPDAGEYMQSCTVANRWDSSQGTPTDITLTVT